ncbi:MAG: DNA-protecting protein DprA [Planctomycetota bacterium]|nr:MAG: DNA-protecting protein DprA [Planctomycetota bacterium]
MTQAADAERPDASAWENLRAEVRLALTPGVGPRTRNLLLARFGDAESVFRAAPSDLQSVGGVGPKIASAIVAAREIDIDAEIDICRENGIAILTQNDPQYPRPLHEIPDPPGVLFVRGALQPSDALAVAIVGSRHATPYGLAQAERLAGGLARAGFTVVSGLARGIDGAAHRAALAAGGRTLAVLGGGILQLYPPEHAPLAAEVANSGAVMSEVPPRMAPMGGAFPQRNRIITGLSLGTIVVEASDRSGALISAKHANEQGREVFAVPGRVDNRMARGCHRLIRDGARLVETVDDVLEELGPLVAPATKATGEEIRHPAELQLNEIEQQVLQNIDGDATSIDAIIARSGLPTHQVLSTISVLEVRRVIRRLSGSTVARI